MNKIIIPVLASVLILSLISFNDAFALTEDAKLTASDAATGDFFGESVSISGDTAIVGAFANNDECPTDPNCNSGSAYVFRFNGTTWSEEAKLIASDAAPGEFFGWSVSISEDTAIVGAFRNDSFFGAAYVFTRSGDIWTEQTKLTASDAAAGDQFGSSVSISGDTAIVGAFGDDDTELFSGSAYVFTRSGDIWTEQAKLTASDPAFADRFGSYVSISGDTVIVGVSGDDDDDICQNNFRCNSGSAYVFVKPAGGWVNANEDAKLTASDAAPGNSFGSYVSISGDTVIVGSPGDDDGGIESGSAYVFVKPAGGWTNAHEDAKLTASDATELDRFGFSVSISEDTAIVGAAFNNYTCKIQFCGSGFGSAYVFTRSGDVWTEQAKLKSSDGAQPDRFGNSVSISGDTVIVGAVGDVRDGDVCPSSEHCNSGSAYVFELNLGILTLIDQIIALGLPDNVTNGLIGPLSQAQNLLVDDIPQNDQSVCGKITGFLNEVDAKEGNGELSSEQASGLRATAQAIENDLGC